MRGVVEIDLPGLIGFGGALRGATAPEELFRLAVGVAARALESTIAVALSEDVEAGAWQVTAVTGDLPPGGLEALQSLAPLLAARARDQGDVVTVAPDDRGRDAIAHSLSRLGFEASLYQRFTAAGSQQGLLVLARRTPEEYGLSQRLLLGLLVTLLSAGLDRLTFQGRLAGAERHYHEAAALFESVQQISRQLDLEVVLKTVVERARELLRTDVGLLTLVAEDAGIARMRITAGATSEEMRAAEAPYELGFCGAALREGRPVYTNDLLEDARRFEGFDRIYSGEGLTALMCAPMFVGSTAIGFLYVGNRDAGSFAEADAALLQALADVAAIALHNARLYDQQRYALDRLHETNAELAAQHALLRRSLDLHDQLTELVLDDRGLAAIAATLARLVENPVVIEDRFLRLIAHSPETVRIDRHRRQTIADRGTPRDVLEDADIRAQFDLLVQERRPIQLPARPELGMEMSRIVAPVVVGREVLGYLSILESNRTLDQLDFVTIEHAATIVALEMMKEKTAAEVELRLCGDLLDALFLSDGEEAALISRAQYLGYNLEGRHCVAVVTTPIEAADGRLAQVGLRRLLDATRHVLVDRLPAAIAVPKDDAVVVLWPLGETKELDVSGLAQQLGQEIARYAQEAGVAIGIGGEAARPTEVRRSYDEAKECVAFLRRFEPARTAITFDQLGVYRIIARVGDRGHLTQFADDVLGALIEYDAQHHSELVKTLGAFLGHNCNLRPAAQALFVHPHTLRYRLDRIQQIAGLDLDDAEQRLQAQIALKILALDCGRS
ncbi:MAG: helix-turn-helix domain-containing protein [Chloroflexi bacterium]|nr:helix-turn-helix domain-containing protein [Chloroflexota bacterium]